MKINIVEEIVKNHSQEEIIDFLATLLNGVLQNYRTAAAQKDGMLLFTNLGDLTLAYRIIKVIDSKNKEISASTQE